MAIRYDKKLNEEINRTIRNFNQKISRLEKEERKLLPSKISKKELKGDVYSRTDLRRKLKELQRFSKRGAEDIITTKGGLTTTRYEIEKLKRENARVKRNISREIKRLEQKRPTIFGRTQAATFAQMGDITYLNLLARRKALEKDVDLLDKEQFQRLKGLVEKSARNRDYLNSVFKNNYLEMLTYLGYFYGYDTNKLRGLEDKLKKLKPSDMYKLFTTEKSIKAITEYYKAVSLNLTKKKSTINPEDIEDDVNILYDNLIDNIEDILKDYA